MKVAMIVGVVGVVSAYETEWAEFQAAQGSRNGQIPEAFKANVDTVKAHNAKESSYSLTYTGPFADLSQEDFVARYTGLGDFTEEKDVPTFASMSEADVVAGDAAVDWTTRGAVNPIKDQGQCGSCWAFSAIGTLESAWQIATGTLHSLAEQQLVDCDKSNSGCDGGWPHRAYDSYITQAGYCSESSYSYTARDGSCQASCDVKLPQGSVTGHTDVDRSAGGLKSALLAQPVSVTVNADQLQLYGNGVVTGDCSGTINHAVMAVGFGTDGLDYFKLRNSWGTGWGEGGYIRISQSGGSKGTACLFEYAPVTPTLSTSPTFPTCDVSGGGVICTCTAGCGMQPGQSTPCVAAAGTDCSAAFSGATCCSRPTCEKDLPICTCTAGCGLGDGGSSPCACAAGTDCSGSFSGCTCCSAGLSAEEDFISKLFEHSFGGHGGGDLSATLLGSSGDEVIAV